MVSMMMVGDDLMFADALCVAVDHTFEIAGVAASLEEAAAIAAREGPDVALVALDHLGGDGVSDAGATIRGASPATVLVAIAADAAAHPIDELLPGERSAVEHVPDGGTKSVHDLGRRAERPNPARPLPRPP